jgi:hypothetical protein
MSSFKSQEFRKEFLKKQLDTSSNVLVQKINKEIEENDISSTKETPFMIYALILKEGFKPLAKIINNNHDSMKQETINDLMRSLSKVKKSLSKLEKPENNYFNNPEVSKEYIEEGFKKLSKALLNIKGYIKVKEIKDIAECFDVDFKLSKKALKKHMMDNCKAYLKNSDFVREDEVKFSKFLTINLENNSEDFSKAFKKIVEKADEKKVGIIIKKLDKAICKNKEIIRNENYDGFIDDIRESLNDRISNDPNNEKLKDIQDKLTEISNYQEVTAFSFG